MLVQNWLPFTGVLRTMPRLGATWRESGADIMEMFATGEEKTPTL